MTGTARPFSRIRKIEIGRHDADHCHRFVIDIDRLPNEICIATEATLPQSITEQHDMVVAGCVFLRCKSTAVQRFTTEHAEVISSDDSARDGFRLGATRKSKLAGFESADTLKRARAIAVVSKYRIVEIHVLQAP